MALNGREKEFAKNTAILIFGKICTQSISFLLLPLYTAVLEPAEYGVVDLITTYNTLLLTLVNWQFDQGLFRFMLDDRKNTERNKGILSSVLCSNILQAACFVIIFIILSPLITLKYKNFLAVDVVISVFLQLFMQFSRGIGKNGRYAAASFISAAGTVILNIVFLLAFHMQGEGLLYSIVCAKTLAVLYLIFSNRIWKYIDFKLTDFKLLKQIRRYSLPLIPNNLAWWIVNASDRTIVSAVLGTAINGIYSVANKFSNVFINFYNILSLSWTESVSLHFNDSDRDEFLSAMATTLFNLFAAACFGIIGCLPVVFKWFVNDKYAEAYPHIAILMTAMLFRVLVGLYSAVYLAQKRTASVMYTTLISAAINLVVNLSLINTIGLYAASFSTLAAFLSMAIYRYTDVNRKVGMRIDKSSLILCCIAACIVLPLYYLNNFWGNIVNFVFVFVFAAVLNRKILRDIPGTVRGLIKKR